MSDLNLLRKLNYLKLNILLAILITFGLPESYLLSILRKFSNPFFLFRIRIRCSRLEDAGIQLLQACTIE